MNRLDSKFTRGPRMMVRELPDGALQIVDGHLRAETTPDSILRVLVVDLDDKEAEKVLATFDPLAAMAEPDEEQLESLLVGIETDREALAARVDWRQTMNQRRWRHSQLAIAPPVGRIFRQGIADVSGGEYWQCLAILASGHRESLGGPASAGAVARNAQMNYV